MRGMKNPGDAAKTQSDFSPISSDCKLLAGVQGVLGSEIQILIFNIVMIFPLLGKKLNKN